MVHEGQQVQFTGPGHEPAQGLLLVVTGSGGHVKWSSGPETGKITFEDLGDLDEVGFAHTGSAGDWWDDSLHVGVVDGFEREAAIGDEEFLWE